MWLLPSRGRPHLIGRVFSVVPPHPETVGMLVLDDDDAASYADVVLPHNWTRHIGPAGGGIGAIVNRVFAAFPNEDFYGVLSDDMVPLTPGWDVEMARAATPFDLIGAHQVHGNRIGAIAMGGDLARCLGWLLCPAVRHFYGDDVMELMIAECGFTGMRADIQIEHLHFSSGRAPYDATYQGRGSSHADREAFEAWKETQWPVLRAKIIEAKPC